MPRVSFFIDGFNVYHSIKAALSSRKITAGKWLDYKALCQHFVPTFGRGATLAEVHYFSALATFLPDPHVAVRHRTLIKALQHTGVAVTLGNFKTKRKHCRLCGGDYETAEEKESDVNIAVALLESFLSDTCDIGVLVTGDTDLVNAVKSAKRLFPGKQVSILFPYKRANNHYKTVADSTYKLPPERYEQFQLPDRIMLADGSVITKPAGW